MRLDIRSRLNNNLKITDDDCWLWTGYIGHGNYGYISYKGKKEAVHRVSAYLNLKYNLKDNLRQVNHKCKKKNCFNPEHLYIGDQYDNVQDSINQKTFTNISRINKAKTHCPKGHPYLGDNLYLDRLGKRKCRICLFRLTGEKCQKILMSLGQL